VPHVGAAGLFFLRGPRIRDTSCRLRGVAAADFAPRWIFVPFALQWLEMLWGITHPAVGFKPKAIGYRQLAVSTLFTALFVITWR
jgi:hypothetical protein